MVPELERLKGAWNDAWLQNDMPAVEKLMANDYIYIAPEGSVMDRRRILEIIRSPTYQLHDGTRTEVAVKALGNDAAAIVHRWRGSGTFDGEPFRDDHRCTMVCSRQGGEWQVVLEQCSAISAP
jgi:ketosteroid isomerase-like protein